MAITKLQPFNLDTTANYTFANITATNANLGNAASANFFIGSGANLTSLPAGNISGQVANALVASTVYTNAQPNITSVGTLTGITSTGTADLTGASNVALGPVANVHITGGSNGQYLQTDGSGILSWSTVSSGSTSTISNGNSNVNIPTSNGNVNISSAGNANIVIVTGTGVNIAGTLNTTGNTTVGNLFSSGSGGNISNVNVISANTFIASGNITAGNIVTSGSGGNISNANVISANIVNATLSANLGNSVTANFFIGSGANLTSLPAGNISGQVANALVASTVYTNAQPNITSVGTLTSLAVTGNITAGNANLGNLVTANFFSGNGSLLTGITVSAGNSIVNGNSNVSVIANGNITLSSAGNANIIVVTGTGVNIAGTLNATGNTTVGNLVSNGSGGNISNANVISANTFIASGNITATNINTTGSGGNIGNANVISANTFTASGNITAGNANLGNSVTANYFIGTFYGTANSATTATSATTSGTVTTAAQPNITSTGTLTSITVSGLGSFGANVNLNSFNITNLATPVASTDAATKQYVDDVAQGLNVHDAVAAATPDTLANITTGTITYNNGSSGVGANLTTTGTFNLIDNVNVQTSGTRILVKSEANAVYNGIYTWSNATVITRATDYNTVPEVEAGDFVFCTGGTLYDNTGWVQTSTVTAIGTTGNNIEFTQFSGAGSYYAGTGLTLTGSTFSVNASQTQITSVGTLGNLTVTGNATVGNLTTSGSGGTLSNINVVSANTFTASGNITAGNANLGNAVTANYFIGNLYGTANLATYATTANSVAGGNVSGQVANALISGTVYTNAQPNITSVGTLSSLTATGNVTGGNLVTAGKVYSSDIINGGTGIYLAAGPSGYINFFTTGGDKASISDTGNIIASNVIANSTVFATTANISGNVNAGNANLGNSAVANFFTGNGSLLTNVTAVTAGTVTTNAQPNITSVGSLTGLTVSNATGVVDFTTTANVTLGAVANLHITGGTNAYVLSTDGSGNLSWVAQSGGGGGSSISNGNSNVTVTANGNVTTSVAGNANILIVTGTGVNIAGTLNATGNITAGNVVTSGSGGNISNANVISANTFIASGDITATNINTTGSGGNIGNANVISANTFTASGNITAGNANLGNNVTANFFTGNGIYLTGITTAGLSNGNSNVNIPSANGNVNISAVGNANVLVVTGTGANITGTANVSGNIIGANLMGPLANGNSNVRIATSNGNINLTAVGNTVMVVTGTGANIAGYANVTGNVSASYFIGNGSLLTGVDTSPSNISNGTSNVQVISSGGNVTVGVGGVANVLKVTSTGANISGTANITGNVTAPFFIGNGFYLTGVDTSPSNISNGTSNVQVNSSGNVTTSVAGNANIVVVTGTGANIAGYANVTGNVSASYFIGNGSLLTGVDTSPSNISNGTSNVQVNASGNIVTSVAGNANILVVTGTGANISGYTNITGNLTAGNISATSSANLGSVSNVTITGGTNGYVLSTNGSGGLSWVAQSGGSGSPGGSNTQIQYNNGGTFGGSAALTFDQVSNVLTITNLNMSGTSNLGPVGNVTITGGTIGYVLSTDGAGNLSWVAQSGNGGGGGNNISNGNSSVAIPTANGNINLTAVGNTTMVVTGTGVNIAGTLNVSGAITGIIVPKVVTIADGTSVTMNADTTELAIQTNTQAAGTLTINAPTGTLSQGQKITFRLQSANIQTFSWNAVFTGSVDLPLPTVSSGSNKYDYMGFIYNTTASKWQLLAKNFGF